MVQTWSRSTPKFGENETFVFDRVVISKFGASGEGRGALKGETASPYNAQTYRDLPCPMKGRAGGL